MGSVVSSRVDWVGLEPPLPAGIFYDGKGGDRQRTKPKPTASLFLSLLLWPLYTAPIDCLPLFVIEAFVIELLKDAR